MIGKNIIKENGINYHYLHLDFNKTDKLTETQIKRTWKEFIKGKEYSKVFIEKRKRSIISEMMYFKNGKLHNEFHWAEEYTFLNSVPVHRKYYLIGKEILNLDEKSWEEYVINWKRYNTLEKILNGINETL